MDILIRQAKVSDVAGIFHVRTSVVENPLSTSELAEMGITPDFVADMIVADVCAWVATDRDEVVGFSMIIQDDACLFAAFVLPSYEGNGIGRRLVNEAEKHLLDRHETCWLETGGATRAAGFYRRLGWSNEQDAGNGDIRMEKRRA